MSGRKRQPLSVIQGKGRSNHITKAEAEKRKKHEERMKGRTDSIVAPSYLTKKQKEEFNEIAEQLVELEIFSNLDIDNLARYIDSRDQYIRVTKELRAMKPVLKENNDTTANNDYGKLMRVRNKLFEECRQSATDLGLSISSRLKLVIPEKEKEEVSEFERKFGDV